MTTWRNCSLRSDSHGRPEGDIKNSRFALVRKWAYIGLAVILLSGLYLIGPISQQQAYHHFADTRTMLGIPNFFNVISNVAYILAGMFGLLVLNSNKSQRNIALKAPHFIFFTFTILIGLGSSYYHLEPNDGTLFWDRLPMSVAFMAFFIIVIERYLSSEAARKLLVPMCLLGMASVFYWRLPFGESTGDLRLYFIVQFGPMLIIPLILLTSARRRLNAAIWGLLFMYVLAKIAEDFDVTIFIHLGFMSGHTLKHVLSAAGIFWYISVLAKEDPSVGNFSN